MRAGAGEPELLRTQPTLPAEFAPLIGVLGQFAAPLDWAAFEAWSRLTRRQFSRWELDVIARVDAKRPR